jgi:hypothetical protein
VSCTRSTFQPPFTILFEQTTINHMNQIHSSILRLTLSGSTVLAQLDPGNPLSGLEKLKNFKTMPRRLPILTGVMATGTAGGSNRAVA